MWVLSLLISLFFCSIAAASPLDALNAQCEGGTIHVPAGTYSLSRFVLTKDCSLVGVDVHETFLECDVTNNNRCLDVPASTQPIRLAHFTLIGHGNARIQQSLAGYVRGIGVRPGSISITIEKLRIIDGGQRAIEVLNPQRAMIRNVQILETSSIVGKEGDGIHVDGWATKQSPPCKQVSIFDNEIERPGDTAISASYCSQVEIARNRIFGASYFGLDASIEESGIDLTGVQEARVYDNQIWRIARYCGYASSYPDEQGVWRTPQDIWFERNFCSQFVEREEKFAGFYIVGKLSAPRQYATGINFINNRLVGFRGTSLLLTAAVKGFRISGNDLHSQNGIPIMIGSSPGRDVSEGEIRGNYLYGGQIKIQSDATKITQ